MRIDWRDVNPYALVDGDTPRRGRIMDAANKRGLTAKGKPVIVSGARNEYATVSLKHGPFAGWSAEYSWAVIERVTNTTGELL